MDDDVGPTFSMELTHVQQIFDELECLQSMFPHESELSVNSYVRALYESAATSKTTDAQVDLPLVSLSLFLQTCVLDNCVPELRVTFPRDYPQEPLDVEIVCPTLPRRKRQEILDRLQNTATECAGDVATLQVYQEATELLAEMQAEAQDEDAAEEAEAEAEKARLVVQPSVIGRRAIYFHHIIAPGKRQVVKDWAKELKLGGFSKIGWPGVIIAEGIEAYVAEYVKRLQHLRWKQMVVRGEQVDDARKLPSAFVELTDMSELAQRCNEAGLSELFLTTMKIYR